MIFVIYLIVLDIEFLIMVIVVMLDILYKPSLLSRHKLKKGGTIVVKRICQFDLRVIVSKSYLGTL